MIAALPASSRASDDVRTYDLVWILHLVGDTHQPLHGSGRYTRQSPDGDAGGNAEQVIPATGEMVALHAYWDSLFGSNVSSYGAVFDADTKDELESLSVNEVAGAIPDPQKWIEESAEVPRDTSLRQISESRMCLRAKKAQPCFTSSAARRPSIASSTASFACSTEAMA